MEKGSPGSKAPESSPDKKNTRKKDNSVNALSSSSSSPNHFQPHNPRPQARIPNPTSPYCPNYRPPTPRQDNPIQINTQYHQVPPPTSFQRQYRPPREFDPIPITYANLLQQLLDKGKINLAPANPNPRTDTRFYNPSVTCVFHSGQVGHDVENCYPLKCKVQDLIDAKKLNFGRPSIARNPLPNYGGSTINAIFSNEEVNGIFGDEEPIYIEVEEEDSIFIEVPSTTGEESKEMGLSKHDMNGPIAATLTRSGRILTSVTRPDNAESSNTKKNSEATQFYTKRKPVAEDDLKAFDGLVKPTEYNVVDQLKRAPAKISMLDLLQTSDKYKRALLEVLQEAHVPEGIEEEKFRNVVGAILAPDFITYSDEDLTADGYDHVNALHICLKS